MGLAQLKVPAIISTGILCFLAGAGVGCLAVSTLGEFWKKAGVDEAAAATGPRLNSGRGGGMGGGLRGRGPSAKNQLATLVGKLDQLSHEPLTLTLSEPRRAKLLEQLHGLDAEEELAEEVAKKRLDAILEIVKDDRATLEAAGYRWPGRQGGIQAPPANLPNPFRSEEHGKHLKALQEQLAKAKATAG